MLIAKILSIAGLLNKCIAKFADVERSLSELLKNEKELAVGYAKYKWI